MENNKQTNSTATPGKAPEGPAMCSACMSFYASLEGMCSSCYKSTGKELPKPKKATPEAKVEEKIPEEEEKPVCLQKNHKFCWDCKKKVGMFGYKCKCTYTFCGFHRLPEDHECSYDHATEARRRLDKNNPALIHDKINKI